MFKIKNILLPTDFSQLSLTAAEYAVALAIQYGAKVHILHVIEKTPPILAIRSLDLSEDKIKRSILNDAKNNLDEAVAKVKKGKKVLIEPVIKKGIDYLEIVKYSKDEKIDVIVIATHGRTGILHTLIGSVAEKVIRFAKCPVLVITPPETNKK
ncbi:MAG: universal stress protein [Ignavibacteriaceae bacterium]|nr:universal stress protein [Ignavibacteriaceae bacterium]